MAIFCLNKMRAQPFSRKLGLFCEVVFMWLHAFHVASCVSCGFMRFMWPVVCRISCVSCGFMRFMCLACGGRVWNFMDFMWFHVFHVVSCVSCGFMCLRLGVASRINCILRAVHPIDDDGLGNFQKF